MKIKIEPTGQEIENNPNKSLLRICQENQVHINSICKGVPKCAECRIRIIKGDENVLPPNSTEKAILGNNYYLDGRRLACQVHAFGDITIDISEQVERDQSAHKKVRGFRSQGQQQQQPSKAVLDTYILNETPADQPENKRK